MSLHPVCPLQMQGCFLSVSLGPSVQMLFSENWELNFKSLPSRRFHVSWGGAWKTLEPGTYWKVQPPASGSFLWSLTTLRAGPGDIFHICFPATAGVGSHRWLILGCLNTKQSRLLAGRAEVFLEMTSVWTGGETQGRHHRLEVWGE